jgi:hypothetical protein
MRKSDRRRTHAHIAKQFNRRVRRRLGCLAQAEICRRCGLATVDPTNCRVGSLNLVLAATGRNIRECKFHGTTDAVYRNGPEDSCQPYHTPCRRMTRRAPLAARTFHLQSLKRLFKIVQQEWHIQDRAVAETARYHLRMMAGCHEKRDAAAVQRSRDLIQTILA